MTKPRKRALVDEVAQTSDTLRAEARAKLGVIGNTQTAPFREVVRKYGLSYYPLVALGLLAVADTFQAYGFTVLTPEISQTLGISIAAIAGAVALQRLAIAVAPLPVAALSQHRSRRALLCIFTGVGWSLLTLYTGFVTSLLALMAILVADGLTTGSVTALHVPLIMDSYHPEARVRAISVYQAFATAGQVVSPLLVGLLAGVLGFTWRGVFIALGLTSLGMTAFCLRLRDPGFGRWDTQQLRETVHAHHRDAAALQPEEVALGFWEICRRVLLIPTCRRLYAGMTVFGMLTVPLLTFVSFFLDRRWNLGPGARGVFFAFFAACGVAGLLLYGGRGEKQFREAPSRVVRTSGLLLAATVALIALGGVMPVFGAMLACFGLAGACLYALLPGLFAGLLSILPSTMRPHAQSLVAIFQAVGGLVGVLFLAGIDKRFGVGGSMVSIAIPGIAGALIVASAGKFVEGDLDRMIDEVLESEEIRRITSRGEQLPMLSCRKIDFAYGRLQVLFGVDFTVDDGEMVALLGVNGAGKSTLLKAISGIGLPTAGSVRYRGQDITFLDAERRLRLGITQIPGGRAVFARMTVVENLRSFGYTLGRDKRALDTAIDRCLDSFPRLAQRRNSLGATLSGGEQQMLGLCKALILQPRLLLIDELSLGLAPVIVAQLLDMVRQINEDGTAIVLVEQSVNIALNLVDHAYFMEKGEMRFDGRAADLLARDDLLRAVFLHGAGAGGGR